MNSPFDEAKYNALLKGLEISEINYSKIHEENRYDSEFFQEVYLQAEKILFNKQHSNVSQNYKVTDGEHGSVNFEKDGIKFLMAENVKKGYVDISKIKYVSKEVDERNARARVETGDILISIKGTLGEVAVAESWLLPANMNRDLAILKPLSDGINSEFVSIFLMSHYGELQSTRGGSGGVQQMITLERLRKFIIPSFSKEFYEQIQKFYFKSQSLRLLSKQTYKQAENILLEAVGLKDFEPSKEKMNVKNFSESFLSMERIDAEFYQSKYDEIESKIKRYSNGFTFISNEYNHIKSNSTKTKEAYNYIEIGDVNVGDGSASFNLIETNELPANAKYEVKKDDLLISKVRPNRGAVAIIDFDEKNLIVSGAFTVLREKEDSVFSNETLKVLLRTKIYKEWLLKFNVGTQYPVIKDEDILNLPIPKIEQSIQKQISEKIKESQKLKKESENLLGTAKRAVEIAIEETEEKAIEFINAEV